MTAMDAIALETKVVDLKRELAQREMEIAVILAATLILGALGLTFAYAMHMGLGL